MGVDFLDRSLKLTDIRLDFFRNELNDIGRKLQTERVRLALNNRHSCFNIGRLNVGDKSPLEAVSQPFIKNFNIPGRSVGGQDYLFALLSERIEGMEKFLLSGFLACDELNIVNEKNIAFAVFLMDFVHRFFFYAFNDKVDKILASCENYIG